MEEFNEIVKEMITNETVLEMKKYRQHCDIDCFAHCYYVAYTSYKVAKKLNLDYVSITRAAMVHDLFLYDWHAPKGDRKGFHAFTHGKCACNNAVKLFELSEKEKDMIIKHMWPVTLMPPKSIEGFLLTVIDKYCTLKETMRYLSKKYNLKQKKEKTILNGK